MRHGGRVGTAFASAYWGAWCFDCLWQQHTLTEQQAIAALEQHVATHEAIEATAS